MKSRKWILFLSVLFINFYNLLAESLSEKLSKILNNPGELHPSCLFLGSTACAISCSIQNSSNTGECVFNDTKWAQWKQCICREKYMKKEENNYIYQLNQIRMNLLTKLYNMYGNSVNLRDWVTSIFTKTDNTGHIIMDKTTIYDLLEALKPIVKIDMNFYRIFFSTLFKGLNKEIEIKRADEIIFNNNTIRNRKETLNFLENVLMTNLGKNSFKFNPTDVQPLLDKFLPVIEMNSTQSLNPVKINKPFSNLNERSLSARNSDDYKFQPTEPTTQRSLNFIVVKPAYTSSKNSKNVPQQQRSLILTPKGHVTRDNIIGRPRSVPVDLLQGNEIKSDSRKTNIHLSIKPINDVEKTQHDGKTDGKIDSQNLKAKSNLQLLQSDIGTTRKEISTHDSKSRYVFNSTAHPIQDRSASVKSDSISDTPRDIDDVHKKNVHLSEKRLDKVKFKNSAVTPADLNKKRTHHLGETNVDFKTIPLRTDTSIVIKEMQNGSNLPTNLESITGRPNNLNEIQPSLADDVNNSRTRQIQNIQPINNLYTEMRQSQTITTNDTVKDFTNASTQFSMLLPYERQSESLTGTDLNGEAPSNNSSSSSKKIRRTRCKRKRTWTTGQKKSIDQKVPSSKFETGTPDENQIEVTTATIPSLKKPMLDSSVSNSGLPIVEFSKVHQSEERKSRLEKLDFQATNKEIGSPNLSPDDHNGFQAFLITGDEDEDDDNPLGTVLKNA